MRGAQKGIVLMILSIYVLKTRWLWRCATGGSLMAVGGRRWVVFIERGNERAAKESCS